MKKFYKLELFWKMALEENLVFNFFAAIALTAVVLFGMATLLLYQIGILKLGFLIEGLNCFLYAALVISIVFPLVVVLFMEKYCLSLGIIEKWNLTPEEAAEAHFLGISNIENIDLVKNGTREDFDNWLREEEIKEEIIKILEDDYKKWRKKK